jgi:hypothetical protein
MLLNFIKNNIGLCSFFFIFAAISLLPLNDADSYAYHLAWPKKFIENPYIIFDKSFLEFRVIGIGEILNLVGLIAYTQNFQSFLVLIVAFFYFFLKRNNHFGYLKFYIFFSTPIFLKYIFTQKPMMLSILIVSISIINFFEKMKLKKLNNFDLMFLTSSVMYFSITKYTFMPIAFIISFFCFLFIFKTNFFKNYVIINVLFFFITVFPLSLLKFIHFNDPFTPFLEGYFNVANDQVLQLKNMYQNWDSSTISDTNFITKFISFIVPVFPWTFLDTYFLAGVSILIFGFKKNSNIKYLLILIIFSISIMLLYTNFQARWFLIFFVLYILSFDKFYSNKYKNFYLKILKYAFNFIIFFFTLYFLAVSYIFIVSGKEVMKGRFIYLYEESKKINSLSKNSYVLTNSRSNFYLNNSIGYNNSKYFNSLLINSYKKFNIKHGFFFIGNKIDKPYVILNSFDKNCYEIKQLIESVVKKRNLFSRTDREYYILVEFKKDVHSCLVQ